MAKQPAQRFGSWQEVREALSQSQYRADEPELLITQTSTGVDLPRPEAASSGAERAAVEAASAEPSAAPEKGVSVEARALVAARVSDPALRVPRTSSSSLDVVAAPPALAPPSAAELRSRTSSSALAVDPGKPATWVARLRAAWLASPPSEQRLAIAAVTLLVLTTLFLFFFSGRG